jgi:hypothetical protein
VNVRPPSYCRTSCAALNQPDRKDRRPNPAAIVLAKCLRDAPAVGAALARFEALRRPRVERIIK